MKNIIGEGLKVVHTNELKFEVVPLEVDGKGILENLPEYVFLGGTCNGSTWREDLIPLLDLNGISYFNPVVKEWTVGCKRIEDLAKRKAEDELYVITSDMIGVYSIAEAVHTAATRQGRCIFMVIEEGFGKHQLKSLEAVKVLIKSSGGIICNTYDDIIKHLLNG